MKVLLSSLFVAALGLGLFGCNGNAKSNETPDRTTEKTAEKTAAGPKSPKPASPTPESPSPSTSPANAEKRVVPVVSWKAADQHYGKIVTIEGKIVLTKNIGRICFLNFDPDYRNTFTAVIKRDNYSHFPKDPENFYRGKKVRVTGTIRKWKGAPEMILSTAEEIEVIE